ncbi:hypothetical protein H5410_059691 [Solanum commersonii]|uniref:Uncharacterized protein n=1 Tax=Solanum commersonii TaxID=4109 RepID=A0A9J5W340_SOLCO|nr:hypothetical protein H5410_059691 [Solanum commersonii]
MDVPQLDSSNIVSFVESPIPINQSLKVYPDIQYFSSNGILLITYFDDIIVMWNPTTRESRRIPSPIQNKYGGLYNFFYFPRIDEYKIFRLGPRLVNDGVIYMMASRAENDDHIITIVHFCLVKEQFQDELLFPCMMEGRRPVLYRVGEKLCLKLDGNMMFQKYPGSGFVVYNSTTHKLEQVNVTGIETSFYFDKVVTYVETLSSPNS